MDLRKFTDGCKKFLSKDRRLKLMVLLGVAGMLLILFSQSLGGNTGENTAPDTGGAGIGTLYTAEEYIAKTEEKLCALITQIEGVGRAEVMVTLENNGEYVYAQEEKRNLDKNVEPGGDGQSDKITSKENIQVGYILVESGYGSKEPLIRTQLEPKIQGVVIICEGADNIRVEQSLINVATTTLGISSARVCVEKIALAQ
jgi:stage III sporulation protein AG